MSSTNRGAERKPSDFYPTPAATTEALIRWAGPAGLLNNVRRVIDPCAGDGAILRVAQRRLGVSTRGIELRHECDIPLSQIGDCSFLVGADAFGPEAQADREWCWREGSAVITNPPFSLAREFVEFFHKADQFAAFLLRLGFLASQKRAPWWVARPPAHVLVLPERPSFTGDGKTDSADYAWVVWRGTTERGATQLDWLVSP